MILLDTNVLSELARPVPDPNVLAWVDAQPPGELATSAVTAAELWYGVARLPVGRRRSGLIDAVDGLLNEDLGDRVLPFDMVAAAHCARIVASREAVGLPISVSDAQIAAICVSHRAPLATRNTKDFQETGVSLIDPWVVR